ncbi:MAG: outer membrane beta-barrel protein [Bacteroidota bacterium]
MKKLLLAVVVLALAVGLAAPSNAQGKMVVSVGGDFLLPMGTFGDAYSIGFGGSARGQYNFTPMFSAGLTAGYYTWTGKDIAGSTVKPSFSGVPVRVFGKYYFMPEGKARFYGIAELGLFFWSSKVSTPVITTPFGTFGGEISSTGSDFNYAPGVGVEIAAGKVTVDVSARYDGIATSGSSSGSLGARVGVNFPI